MFNLKDKKVLIVGATGGIGSALTKTFAEAGAILGLATRDEEALNKLSSELSVKNYKYIVDLSDLKGLEEFIEKADQEMSGIDIMLCNAGITKDSLSMKMKTEDLEKPSMHYQDQKSTKNMKRRRKKQQFKQNKFKHQSVAESQRSAQECAQQFQNAL